MENLKIYNEVRAVPPEAQKSIGGGRLKGMTDINPMWRIKTLTEQFGTCGFGWYYEIADKWIETAMAKDEITANVKINLYIKIGDEWSKPIVGVGGSMLVASETKGLYVNDECYKMALTDAISVACKSLGMGADIYWNKDNTKYNDGKKDNIAPQKSKKGPEEVTPGGVDYLINLCIETNTDPAKMMEYYHISSFTELTAEDFAKETKRLEERLNNKDASNEKHNSN